MTITNIGLIVLTPLSVALHQYDPDRFLLLFKELEKKDCYKVS